MRRQQPWRTGLDIWFWFWLLYHRFWAAVPIELLVVALIFDLPLFIALWRLGARHSHVPECISEACAFAAKAFKKIINGGK